MRLLVLETDQVSAALQLEHGDYPLMFDRLIQQGLERARECRAIPEVVVETLDVTRAQRLPDPQDYDAYLITGSKHSVYQDLPWIAPFADFVGKVMKAERRIVGICFGHQLFAHFFGGEVRKAPVGWAVGVHHNEFLELESWMEPPMTSLALQSSHQDQVMVLPTGARCLARTPLCPNAVFMLGERVLGIQSHPEFSPEYMHNLMLSRTHLLGESTLQAGVQSLQCPTDNRIAAQWIMNFLTWEQVT